VAVPGGGIIVSASGAQQVMDIQTATKLFRQVFGGNLGGMNIQLGAGATISMGGISISAS
jgi:hypothetical protein